MTLTLGGHHVVTGAGQFAIAQPVGLVVSIAGIPNYVARDTPTPVRYKQLAFINLGNALGWQPRIAIEHIPQIFYPIEPEFTLLRHNLLAGETATIDEIATSTTLMARPDPWDRSPTSWSQTGIQFPTEPSAATTLWTYTVPAGRLLWIAAADLSIVRTIVATTNASAHMHLQRGGVDVLNLYDYTNVALSRSDKSLGPDGLVLLSGETIACTYQSGSIGGQHLFLGNATGYSFAV